MLFRFSVVLAGSPVVSPLAGCLGFYCFGGKAAPEALRPDLFAGFGIFLDIARLTVRLQRGLPVRILFKRFADMGKPGLFFTIFFLAGTFLPLPAAGIDGYPPPLAEEAGVGGGDTGRKEIFRLILQNPAYAVPDKLRALDSLLWLSPKDGRQVLALLDQKARLLEREGDYPRAREAYRSALAFWEQEFPEDEAAGGELRYNEARLAFYEGDYEESSNLLYRILEDTRNAALRARAHSLLAMVLINAGQIPLAEDHIFRAQRIVDSVEVDTGTLFAVSNHKAALLYEQGCYSEVLEEMKRVERYAISLGKADYLSIHNQNIRSLPERERYQPPACAGASEPGRNIHGGGGLRPCLVLLPGSFGLGPKGKYAA